MIGPNLNQLTRHSAIGSFGASQASEQMVEGAGEAAGGDQMTAGEEQELQQPLPDRAITEPVKVAAKHAALFGEAFMSSPADDGRTKESPFSGGAIAQVKNRARHLTKQRTRIKLQKWGKLSSAAAQTTLTLSYFESANEAREGGRVQSSRRRPK